VNDLPTDSVRESYDRLAAEYARRIFDELQHKPLDRELLDRFAAEARGRGEICDMGCGPGHIARYLRDTGATVFGLDLSPGMLEQARRLNPGIPFLEGNMLALGLLDEMLAGIAAFYAIVNIPKESLPRVFRELQRVCCYSDFTAATKPFMRMNCGGSQFQWSFSFFSQRTSGVILRRQGWPLKRSASGIPIRKWSIKAEEPTSLPESQIVSPRASIPRTIARSIRTVPITVGNAASRFTFAPARETSVPESCV
jgi:ubiquinone/menaquinone biosynthesis C-methylase UbiE